MVATSAWAHTALLFLTGSSTGSGSPMARTTKTKLETKRLDAMAHGDQIAALSSLKKSLVARGVKPVDNGLGDDAGAVKEAELSVERLGDILELAQQFTDAAPRVDGRPRRNTRSMSRRKLIRGSIFTKKCFQHVKINQFCKRIANFRL